MREHLHAHPLALNFVGMGIGKTGATLSVLAELIQAKKAKAALVVAPLRVCNLTWPHEVANFNEFKWLRVANLRTELGRRAFITGAAHIYTLNYESLPKLAELIKKRGGKLPYDVEVWDELTRCKNPTSKRIQAFRRSVPRAKRRWGLTGTPVPNSLLDLFAQVRIIDDGERLGKSFDHFKQTYFTKADYMGYKWEIRPGSSDTIHERISDITLTLRSSDHLKIPDTVVEDIEVPLEDDLTNRYRRFERDLILPIRQGKEITATTAAALVSKLLQFTSGRVYDENKVWHEVHDLKLERLKQLIKKIGKPTIVAYAFQHEKAVLRQALPQAKFVSDYTTIPAQLQMIRDWNDKKIPVLCTHPASSGHGLNMQYGCSDMIWFSLTYNKEWYEQLICRIARTGQTEITNIYRLMCPGTVDDAVATAILEKQKTESNLLSALMMLESYRRNGGTTELVERVADTDWI